MKEDCIQRREDKMRKSKKEEKRNDHVTQSQCIHVNVKQKRII